MKDRLIFCRTPLQTLIASEIQRLEPARDTVLYQPTTTSPKHRRYFDAMTASNKVFIEWISEERSHFGKEILSYFSIPASLRRRSFDEYLVSSFDSLVFSLLTARKDGVLKTFDDGVMNLLPSEMMPRIANEHWIHRWLKRIAGGRNNGRTLEDSVVHYSIFDRDYAYFGRDKIVEIVLFSTPAALQNCNSKLTVLLGSPVAIFPGETTAQIVSAYEQILANFPRDIFVPHPAEQREPEVNAAVQDSLALKSMISMMIAEDVVLHLHRLGYRVQVYGIASTTLVNLARDFEVFNIVIPGVNDAEAGLFESYGVRAITCAELPDQVMSI